MPPLLIHSREEWENLIITSFQAGASIRSLSREFKVSRNTIRRVLRAHHIINRKFPNLIRRHKDAFEYFQGVPRQCLYDGEKTVVLRREAGMPVFNPAYVAFITHYGWLAYGTEN